MYELNPAERSIEAGSVCSGQSYWSVKNLFLVSVTGKNPPPAEYIWCFICEQTDARNSFFNMVHFPFDGCSCIIKLASHAEHWTAFRDTFLKRKLSRSVHGAQECLFISISDDWSNNLLDNQRDILQLLKNAELFLAVHFLTCHHDAHLFLFRFIIVATEQQHGSLRKEYLNAVSNSMSFLHVSYWTFLQQEGLMYFYSNNADAATPHADWGSCLPQNMKYWESILLPIYLQIRKLTYYKSSHSLGLFKKAY